MNYLVPVQIGAPDMAKYFFREIFNQPTYGGLPTLFDGPTVLTKSVGHLK
jgi:hypothetical protein